MNASDHVVDLIEMYALGALAAEERATVERHLIGCAACRQMAAEVAQTVGQLSYAGEELAPAPETRRRLMARIEADLARVAGPTVAPAAPAAILPRATPERKARRDREGGTPWPRIWHWLADWSPALAAAGLILLIAMGLYAVSLRSELARTRASLALVNDPNLQAVTLATTQAAPPGARARLLLSPDRSSALLTLSGVKPLAASQTYEFWLIQDGKPLPAGIFKADAAGNAQFLVQAAQPLRSFQQAGITIEPAGGSQAPTVSAMLFAGPL